MMSYAVQTLVLEKAKYHRRMAALFADEAALKRMEPDERESITAQYLRDIHELESAIDALLKPTEA